MNNNFIFFLVSTLIAILSVALFNLGPSINGKLGPIYYKNCLKYSDDYVLREEDQAITDEQIEDKEKDMNFYKKRKNICYREKGMYGLEYSSFIINVTIGSICSLLGFLHYLGEGKSFVTKTGLIGLFSGVIGFIITLVYVIHSAIVFTNDSYFEMYKSDKNLVYAIWDSSSKAYICSFYNDKDTTAPYPKFNELGKKQYNYNKEKYIAYEYHSDKITEIYACQQGTASECRKKKELTFNKGIQYPYRYYDSDGNLQDCQNLYIRPVFTYNNKELYDRWLATLILSIIMVIFDICLTIFGFLLYKNKESSTGGINVIV